MTSRRYGDSSASPLDVMLAHSAVLRTGTVAREEVINGRRSFLVSFPNAAEAAPYCEAVNISPGDRTSLVGARVLVAQLGDGRSVIIGTLNGHDDNLSQTSVKEPNANQTRGAKVGPDDRVFEWGGSQIIFTADGDIVLKPKRAVRVQTVMMRVEVNGDAGDSPVAAQPFLEWARSVDAMLARHEQFVVANGSLTGSPHSHIPATLTASAPDIGSVDVFPEGVKMPTGGS